MFTLDSGTDCQVIKTYGVKEDKWGKVVTLFVTVPRKKPSGEPTGNSDSIIVEFRIQRDLSMDEATMFMEACSLKPGDFLHFTGNLHCQSIEDKDGGRKFSAKVSGKSIATHYHMQCRKRVEQWHEAQKRKEEVV